jgi:hypothetical protein
MAAPGRSQPAMRLGCDVTRDVTRDVSTFIRNQTRRGDSARARRRRKKAKNPRSVLTWAHFTDFTRTLAKRRIRFGVLGLLLQR